jgi:hypothetical protein
MLIVIILRKGKPAEDYGVKVDSATAHNFRRAGFSLRETARLLGPGVSYMAVRRALKRTEKKA